VAPWAARGTPIIGNGFRSNGARWHGERDPHIRRAARALCERDRGALAYLYVRSVDRLARDLTETLGAGKAKHLARLVFGDVWAEPRRFDADACSFDSWLRELARRSLSRERAPAAFTP
jgi:hypothetical protein